MSKPYEVKSEPVITVTNQQKINKDPKNYRIFFVAKGEGTITQQGQEDIQCRQNTMIRIPANATGEISKKGNSDLVLVEISAQTASAMSQARLFPSATTASSAIITAQHTGIGPFNTQGSEFNTKTATTTPVDERVTEYKSKHSKFSVALVTVPNGKSTRTHCHPKDGEIMQKPINGDAYYETYLILSGTGTLEIDGKNKDVQAGSVDHLEPGQWHQIKNTGTGDLVFIVICAPEWSYHCMIFDDSKVFTDAATATNNETPPTAPQP